MMRSLVLSLALLTASCSTAGDSPSSLRVATWNLEHLAEADGSGCRPRTEADYAALRAMAQQLQADIIAFQEVESEVAAQRVFDPQHFTIAIEERAGSASRAECRGLPGQHLNRQAVGFAIRRGLEIERHADVSALQLGDANLRSGVDIEVGPVGGPRVRLLSVHLKSGCASGAANDACPTLLAQAPILEAWIDQRASAGERFVVLGDFNRRLAAPGDAVWADLNDGEPSPLALAADEQTPRCDPRYNAFIDHIVTTASTQPLGFQEWTFGAARLSDHCPIGAHIPFAR